VFTVTIQGIVESVENENQIAEPESENQESNVLDYVYPDSLFYISQFTPYFPE